MADQYLVHPQMGGICFGNLIEWKSRHETLPAGEIRLSRGRHHGPNKGYGACHIWAEHQAEMAVHGLNSLRDVPCYVALIIKEGTPLYYEGGSYRHMRLTAVQSTYGMAVLEFKDRREGPIWSVVTAYSRTRAHGTRIGAVR